MKPPTGHPASSAAPGGASSLAGRLGRLARSRPVRRAIVVFAQPLAGILMMHGAWIGIPLWLVVAQDLRRAAFAAVGLLIGEAVRILLRVEERPGSRGCLKVNALLTSLAVSWLLPPEGLAPLVQLGLVALAASIAAVFSAAFVRALQDSSLPPLVWGYVTVAGIMFIIFPEWALSAAVRTDWGELPVTAHEWADAFLRTLGAFLFAPDAGSGLIIAITILVWSRTMFFAGVVGWVTGLLTGLALSDLGVLFYWLPAAYNFFLAGMALGSVYFLPGWSSLAAAAFAGCVAAFVAVGLQHLLDFSAAAFLPLPLCLTVWAGITALQSATRDGRLKPNRLQDMRPEDAWWLTTLDVAKWGRHEDLLMIPVDGEVVVTQGFSGRISHIGRWRHALDFQRPNHARRDAKRGASIFGTPVLAPAPGVVERVQNNVVDNPLGKTNFAENWGNFVVIALDIGGWALLGHLRKGSIPLTAGARVDFGTVLGEVGNSGRSPVPHLHVQVQAGPAPGAATVPFRLANFLYATSAGEPLATWTAAAVPAEGSRIRAAKPVPGVHRLLAGISPGRALWSLDIQGKVPEAFRPAGNLTSLRIEVTLDSAGRQVFTSREGEVLVSRYDPDAWRVVELDRAISPLLRLLSLALPSVPYAAQAGIRWSDVAIVSPEGVLGHLWRSLLPYRTRSLVGLESHCLTEPKDSGGLLTIETRPVQPHPRLPRRMVCELREIEGPCMLFAEFPGGTITYSLYSFKPTVPYPQDDEIE